MIKRSILILIALTLTACGSSHELTGGAHIEIDSTTNTIHIINPIIEFCERLYPTILYPDALERERGITDCLRLCSEGGECTVDVGAIDGLLPGGTP